MRSAGVSLVTVAMGCDTFCLLREWQAFLQAQGRIATSTQQLYLRTILTFLSQVLKPLHEVTAADVQAVILSTTTKGGYRGLLLRSLKSFYGWGARHHGLANPAEDFYIPRPRAPKVEYLKPAELDALFAGAEAVDPRARPTFELIYGTCARIHQTTEVRFEDVDLEERAIHFECVKNDVPYDLALAPRAFAACVRLLELRDYSPRYGKRRPGKLIGVGDQSVRNWIQAAGRETGLQRRLYPHLLRKTALSRLANDPEVSIAVLVKAAHWRDASPMPHYVAPYEREERIGLAKL